MSKKTNDIIVIGFALFAMFLGAGNLIFPPTLGHLSGKDWIFSLLGFLVTGVGMPVLGIISMGKMRRTSFQFYQKYKSVIRNFFYNLCYAYNRAAFCHSQNCCYYL